MKIKISTRVVTIFNKFVIKFPVSRRGYLQGKNEADLWRRYRHLGMLGKIYFEFCGIVVMKRYEPLNRPILKAYVKGIKMLIPELAVANCDLFNSANWGYDDGCLILIDYGINEQISKLYN